MSAISSVGLEHLTFNQVVRGSNPLWRIKYILREQVWSAYVHDAIESVVQGEICKTSVTVAVWSVEWQQHFYNSRKNALRFGLSEPP